jgi:putative membrane protein
MDTAVLLVSRCRCKMEKKLHENLMKTAITCSVAFFWMYRLPHDYNTKFGGEGNYWLIYFLILITHIMLINYRHSTRIDYLRSCTGTTIW